MLGMLFFFLWQWFTTYSFFLLQRKKEKKRLEKENAVKVILPVSLVLLILLWIAHKCYSFEIEFRQRGLFKSTLITCHLIFLSSQEDEQWKSDSSENQEENPVIESNTDANGPPEFGETQNAADTVGCDESSGDNNNEEETLVKMNKKEDEEQKVCAEFYISICHVFFKATCELLTFRHF